jgi:hypothetical protein
MYNVINTFHLRFPTKNDYHKFTNPITKPLLFSFPALFATVNQQDLSLANFQPPLLSPPETYQTLCWLSFPRFRCYSLGLPKIFDLKL